MINTKRYLTRSQLAERYNKTTRSIVRWEKDPALGFPAGFVINGRWLFDEAEVERWEQARAAAPRRAA